MNGTNEACTCPECGGRATRPHFGSHPVSEQFRTAAYYSVPYGFVLFVILLCTPFGEMLGQGFGFNMMGMALAPAAFLCTLSMCYPKVWLITCSSCRKVYFRGESEKKWRTAPRRLLD